MKQSKAFSIFEKNPSMGKIFLAMVLSGLTVICSSQSFLREGVNSAFQYVVLANPTVNNLETIRFLVDHNIFKVDREKIKFIGVYHKSQAYDFLKSREYIQDHPLAGFHLHEITGDLNDSALFRENGCSNDFRTIFRNSAGIIFFGGPDIQPGIYGEDNSYSVVTDPRRHSFEVSFLFHLLGGSRNPGIQPLLREKPDYLVTGFCLGVQTMNVATGGTLYQDIPAQVYGKNITRETITTDRNNLHRNYWQEINNDKQLAGINIHTIRFTNHPFFKRQIGIPGKYKPKVYSSHHQAPKYIGAGFDVTALSSDGKIVEGITHRDFPHVFGVQFHPEIPALYEDRELWKISPEDEPKTYHQMIGKEGIIFHRKYWRYISRCLEKSIKRNRRKMILQPGSFHGNLM